MVGDASPNKYTEISQRLIQQAEEELQKGDPLQASEKAWGAVAHAVKSIAEQRGWRHNSHDILYAVSGQIADELGQPDLRAMFRSANSMHTNYYENWMAADEVQSGIDEARTYLRELAAVRAAPTPDFIPQTLEQAARLRRLTTP